MASEDERATPDDLSWDCGPAESRFLRLLIYPAMGIIWGLILGFVALFGPPFVARFADGLPPWLFFGLLVAVVAFAPVLWASVRTNRARRERSRLAREWRDVTYSGPSLAATLVVASVIVAVGLQFDWSFETYLAVSFAGVLAGQALGVLAWFLRSSGRIDPETLTLSYAGRNDVDLRRLRDVKTLSLGRYAVVWLLVSKHEESGGSGVGGIEVGTGTTGRTKDETARRTGGEGQDLYAMPTEVVERARPAFEDAMAARRTDEPEARPGGILWRVNFAVALALLAGGIGALAFFAWLGLPTWQLLQWLWILSCVGYFFLRFLARTY